MIPLSYNTLEIRFLDGPGGGVDGIAYWNPNTGKVIGYLKDIITARLRRAAVRGYYSDYLGSVQVNNPFYDPHDFKAIVSRISPDIEWPPELANIKIRWIEQPPLPPGAAY